MASDPLAHVRRTFRIAVFEEWRLGAGAIGVLLGYGLWVGLTAAALGQLATFAGLSTSVDPWTDETTALAVLFVLLWIVLPALGATVLVRRGLTNVNHNLERYYRVSRPIALLVPPVLIGAGGVAAVLALGRPTRPLLGIVLVGSVYLQLRTIAYSYRVYSLSLPRAGIASFLPTAAILAVVLMVETALAVGREEFVTDVGDGLGSAFGLEHLASTLTGTTAVGPLDVPTLLAAGIALPAVLSLAYVTAQVCWSVGVRLRAREVPRSTLRTGQRYPDFAKPTTTADPSPGAAGATSDERSAPDGTQTSASPDTATPAAPTTTDANSTAPTTTDATAGQGTRSGDEDDVQVSDTAASGGANGGEKTAQTDPSMAEAHPQSDTPDSSADSTSQDDDVSHTRVFTPDETDKQTRIAGDEAGQEPTTCPYCDATLAPEEDTCPACGASV